MTNLTIKLLKLDYEQPHNKTFFYKFYKEIPIKIYVNQDNSLIECLSVGSDEPSYSKEDAELRVKAWELLEQDLKGLEQYMEGNNV